MQHLRRAQSTSRSLLSLARFYCDLTAAKTPQAGQTLVSRQLISSSCVASQQTPSACLCRSWPLQDLQSHWRADFRASPSSLVCSRGFASQSASRLKQSVARAKRIAQQQHGGRGGAVTDALDPTSNEAVETIPQDQSSVQASQSQATDLQVPQLLLLALVTTWCLNVTQACQAACWMLTVHTHVSASLHKPSHASKVSMPVSSSRIQSNGLPCQVEDVVGHPALVITRNVEWGTVIFGFEQANKYTIYDQEGNVVALLAEELGSFGKEVGRQLLRTRRPFTATVFSPDGMTDHHQDRLVHACFETCRHGLVPWLDCSKS